LTRHVIESASRYVRALSTGDVEQMAGDRRQRNARAQQEDRVRRSLTTVNLGARPMFDGDGHLALVLFILGGIESETARTQWVERWLPKTSSYLGLLDQSSRLAGRALRGLGAAPQPLPDRRPRIPLWVRGASPAV
jgi:hypothetical protein